MPLELNARENIDRLLIAAGWHICDANQANIYAAKGVAIREFPLKSGFGFADYLLYIDGKAAGVIEAKKEGVTLTGVETQSDKYIKDLPDGLPRWRYPLPSIRNLGQLLKENWQRARIQMATASSKAYFNKHHDFPWVIFE